MRASSLQMIKNRKDSYMKAFDVLCTKDATQADVHVTVSAYAWLRVYVEGGGKDVYETVYTFIHL